LGHKHRSTHQNISKSFLLGTSNRALIGTYYCWFPLDVAHQCHAEPNQFIFCLGVVKHPKQTKMTVKYHPIRVKTLTQMMNTDPLQEGYYTPPDKVSGNKHFRRLVLRTLGRRFVHLRRVGITDRRKDKKSLVRARTWKFYLGWLKKNWCSGTLRPISCA
jgi:hypothetical protein